MSIREPLSVRRATIKTLIVMVTLAGCSDDKPSNRANRKAPRVAGTGPVQAVGKYGYASSDTCRSCHAEQYDSWHATYHRTMTQHASPEAVQAPFDGRTLPYNGVEYQVSRRGDEYWVTTPDPDLEYDLLHNGAAISELAKLPMVERQIAFTTGSHHMQLYWMKSKVAHELLLFPWAFHIPEQRWIPYPESVIVHPDAHWLPLRWNDNCIACHSVGGRPERNLLTGGLWSEVAEFGIACEACHTPAEDHVRRHSDSLTSTALNGDDPTIVQPAKADPVVASQLCGQCHSAFTHEQDFYQHGSKFVAGAKNLDATHNLIRFENLDEQTRFQQDLYWNDGTIRIGGREYLGMVESSCHQNGEMSCLSCHSMHNAMEPNDLLAAGMRGNKACLQCHSDMADGIVEHTHHAADSSGSECYNCHMPHSSYAFFTAIRSHRIDSPDTTTGFTTDRPNACNLCHIDKSLGWTADHLAEWYGMPEATLTKEQADTSAALLWLLKGDAVQRVVAAWHLGWDSAREASGSDWQAPFLALTLDDLYPATRFVTFKSLRTFAGYEDFQYDYIAGESERAQAVRRALKLWTAAAPRGHFETLLLDDHGQPLWDRIEAIRKARDDRFIMLAE